ncbi:MAG: helix-turn-helix transcriptional regulator [Gelidibacter sp.]
MKNLQIHSLPLKDVISDLAEKLGIEYSTNCDEYTLTIPPEIGEGTIVGINFESGLGLLIYRCRFITDVEISFTVDKIHPLKFLFCLEGSLKHRFEKQTEIHQLERYQNIIVASPNHDGHIINFKKDETTEIYSIEIVREIFKSKMACELSKSSPNLQRIFDDDSSQFYYNGNYSLNLAEIFEEMKGQNYEPLIGKLFSETQSYRVLTQQLIQFDDDNSDGEKKVLRKAEVSAIVKAVEMMKTELENLGTLSSIAKRVGLTNEKFQNGFKKLYGKTANEYLQTLRLNLAKDLLTNSDLTIQEIKYKVGFNSHSYFSQLFKSIYDVSPTYFRKNQKQST